MKHTQYKFLSLALAVMLTIPMLSGGNKAVAAGEIYVNNGQSILGMGLNSAYAVGSGGVSGINGRYAITGNGVSEIGQAVAPPVDPGDDGSTVKIKYQTVKIGLRYYYSASRDTSLTDASLENAVGSGYQFGYFDAARNFVPLGSTAERVITMKPSGGGQGIEVTKFGTSTVLYSHDGSMGTRLAVRPISNSGKAKTWFKSETYFGAFEYYRHVSDKLTVVNVLGLEDYIKGVIPSEMSASWPTEALKAQALCARTYYAKSAGNYSKYGFDVTADVSSQAYQGTRRASAASDAAVDATVGKYVTYNGQMCTTLYSSSSGGGTESNENVNGYVYPYLKGVIDPYEAAASNINKNSSWRTVYTPTELGARVGLGAINKVEPTYSATNNCIKIVLTDINGATATVQRDECRGKMGMKSIHYKISRDASGNFVFDGGGWGHNVGMSQYGAYAMAKNYGMNYRQIINFYFTGVKISTGVL